MTPPPEAFALHGPVEPPREPRASLAGAFRSIDVPARASFWGKFRAFTGPAYLVAVGYMDPGNWATDIAAGSRFGYELLFVVALSSIMAMVLQSLSAKLGIAAGRDLAQACGERYSPPTRIALWLLCETAIIACDLAEVIGSAIALQLLFGIPIVWGVVLTGLNVFVIMALERRGFHRLEIAVLVLILVTGGCLAVELVLSRPDLSAIVGGLRPSPRIFTDPAMLYLAIGIIGATVMPHNLYLHSAAVQTRRFARDDAGKREAIRFANIDSIAALTFAFVVNAAILILAASVFHGTAQAGLEDLGEAYRLLSPMLGVGVASVLFGIALLASGQNSTVTGTLAGQVVMEGFTHLRLPPHWRRILTRSLAIVPAAVAAAIYGDDAATQLLILSQVVLSLQLPFAVIPLIRITGDKAVMGSFANRRGLSLLVWVIALLISGLNIALIWRLVF